MTSALFINIIRYLLAIVMIIYGWVKIIGLQFEIPEDVQNIPLGNLDGVTIAFAFLGYSKWLAVASGIVEFGTAVLLVFRKTYLLGALLLFPVLTYVFLVNMGYHFSLFMKIWTGSLLLLNGILLVANRAVLKSIFLLLLKGGKK